MKSRFSQHILLAAVVVLVVGVALGFAETKKLQVKVMKGDSEAIEVNDDGTVELVELADLADGEERSFGAGEHTVTVRRSGDELFVTLNGEELAGLHGDTDHGHAEMVWVGESEDGELAVHSGSELKGKQLVMITESSAGDGPKVIKVKCHGEEGSDVDCEKLAKIDIETIIAGEGEGSTPILVKHLASIDKDVVRWQCAEDGTTIAIPKDKATQERYVCPVCGREMEKLQTPEIKVMTVMERADDDGETTD